MSEPLYEFEIDKQSGDRCPDEPKKTPHPLSQGTDNRECLCIMTRILQSTSIAINLPSNNQLLSTYNSTMTIGPDIINARSSEFEKKREVVSDLILPRMRERLVNAPPTAVGDPQTH